MLFIKHKSEITFWHDKNFFQTFFFFFNMHNGKKYFKNEIVSDLPCIWKILIKSNKILNRFFQTNFFLINLDHPNKITL